MSWKPYLEQLAEEVKNAPSIFNSQPWYFEVTDDDHIDLYVSLDKRSGKDAGYWDLAPSGNGAARLDPLAREFAISCGAALYNLRLAIRVAGHNLVVRLPPHPQRDSTLLASVEIMTRQIKPPTTAEQELYEAMWRRHTNRWPYTVVPAPLPILVAMENAALQEGASLRLLYHNQALKWRHLADEADRYLESPPAGLSKTARERYQQHQKYRKRWVGKEEGGVGVPTGTFGPEGRGVIRKDFWLHLVRRFEQPQLMALSTDDDQLLDWLRAGQALQHAILTGTRYSVSSPYGVTAKYQAPLRYGVPARHHLVRRCRREELAYDGLSVSLLTQPFERYDIERYDIKRYDLGRDDAERVDIDATPQPPRPLPWRFPELPQVVIRVGYAVHRPGVAPRRPKREQVIADARSKPSQDAHRARGRLPESELPERGVHREQW